jgi:MSHA biogenesis protein MshJ
MQLPASVENALTRFDAMSLRERALLAVGMLAILVVVWDSGLMTPLNSKRSALTQELTTVSDNMRALQVAIENAPADPAEQALAQEKALKAELARVDAELAASSAGLIAPERMVDVIQDVLSRQRGVKLISIQNGMVTSLNGSDPAKATLGPYVHPVEMVIEGNYLDVLAYLKDLEALPWQFCWKALELATVKYPVNRVRVEITTLSMDKEWLGV